jgi:hypothetical protein
VAKEKVLILDEGLYFDWLEILENDGLLEMKLLRSETGERSAMGGRKTTGTLRFRHGVDNDNDNNKTKE